jgi:hypothetical protein
MTPFFNADARIATLKAECARGRGTPWSRMSNLQSPIPEVGGDCVSIAAAVYTAAGFDLTGYRPALPSVLMTAAAARQFVLAPLCRLAAAGRARHLPEVKKHDVLPGDLLLLEAANMLTLGIAVGDARFYCTAARPGGKWDIQTLDDKVYFTALTDAWRLLEATV